METDKDAATEQKDLCIKCGTTIEQAIVTHRIPLFGEIKARRPYCFSCDFLVGFHSKRFVARQPYKTPFPRPTADGKAPKDYVDQRAEMLRKQQEAST